jgi:hypothetical protein
MTATLQHFVDPGRKSFLEFVKHHEEQLSIAICFKSKSHNVESPIAVAAMHVIVTSRKLMASILLLCLFHTLALHGWCDKYRYLHLCPPGTPPMLLLLVITFQASLHTRDIMFFMNQFTLFT